MAFPVVMHGCESWTTKVADHQRIDIFKLWCWRRLLRVPWTARRSKQLILNEINPKYSVEALMLKLMLQYFDHLMWRVDLLDKTLMLGKIEGKRKRGRDGWTASLTQWSLIWANSGRWQRTGKPDIPTVHGVIKESTRLSNWTTAKLWMLQVKDNCKDDPWV